MADNNITIPCPICSTGSTKTTTKTDTDTTTTTITSDSSGAHNSTSASANTKVEHATGSGTAIATTSSTDITHTYDLTGYQVPIEVQGIVQESLPSHIPMRIEGLVSQRSDGISPVKLYPSHAPKILVFTCPVNQAQFQAVVQRNEQGSFVASGIEALTPDNSVLFDVGKQIVSDSLKVSSSFCTSMIGVSTGAIGIYTALFAVVLPKTCTIGVLYGLIVLLPALIFILAAVGFAYGAFPISGQFMAGDPQSIETFREALFSTRMSRLRVSFILFCIGMAGAVIVIVLVAGTHLGCTG